MNTTKKQVLYTTQAFVALFVSLAAITALSSLITSVHLPSPNTIEQVIMKKNEKLSFSRTTAEKTTRARNTTLVIVIGNLRGGEQAWESLCTNVLDPSQADLALLIGEFDTNTTSTSNTKRKTNVTQTSLYQRAKYIWTFPEYNDWADAIDLINGTKDWRKVLLPLQLKRRTGFLGGVKGAPRNKGSGAMIMMFRYFLQQHLREEQLLYDDTASSTKNNERQYYDRFVITRSDHFYPCSQNISSFHPLGNNDNDNNKNPPQKNHVWIPSGSDFNGYTDRHLIVARENLYDALDIFPTFFRQPHLMRADISWNPESLIRTIWKLKNITVHEFERTFFTCAVSTDTTRWKKATLAVPGQPGLLQKYTEEYNATQRNCPAILQKRHDTFQSLWEEYQYGSSSHHHKAARYFSEEERAQAGLKYKQRSVIWQCMKELGPDVVMDRISNFFSVMKQNKNESDLVEMVAEVMYNDKISGTTIQFCHNIQKETTF